MCVFPWEEEEIECVEGELVVMCEEVSFMEKKMQTKDHGRKLCVANSCRGVHEGISMNKPLDFLLK